MKNSHLIIFIAALFSGCATSKQIAGPNGTPVHSITCGALVPDQCLEKAGETCPSGYIVLDSHGSKFLGQYGTGSASGQWNQMGGGVSGSTMSVPLVTRNMLLIECKAQK